MKSEICARTKGFNRLKLKFDAEVCRSSVKAALEKSIPTNLLPYNRKRLENVFGLRTCGPVLNYASNCEAMRLLSNGLADFWTDEWRFNCERQLELLVITPPSWWVSEYQPSLDLATWRQQSSRWLKRLGFTGTAIIENAPFRNVSHQLGGKAISFHLTCIGYVEAPHTYKKAVTKLKRDFGPGPVKLPTIVSKPVDNSHVDVAYVAEYSGKMTASAKKAISRDDKKGDVLRNAPMSCQLRLRVHEIMSYLALKDVIVVRGPTGKLCKNKVFHMVGHEAVTRSPNRMNEAELKKLWLAVWQAVRSGTKSTKRQAHSESYEPVQVLRNLNPKQLQGGI